MPNINYLKTISERIKELFDDQKYLQVLSLAEERFENKRNIDHIAAFDCVALMQRNGKKVVDAKRAACFRHMITTLYFVSVAYMENNEFESAFRLLLKALNNIILTVRQVERFHFENILTLRQIDNLRNKLDLTVLEEDIPSFQFNIGLCFHKLGQYKHSQVFFGSLLNDKCYSGISKIALAESYYDESCSNFEKTVTSIKLFLLSLLCILIIYPPSWMWFIREEIIICLGLTFLGGFLLCKISKYLMSLFLPKDIKQKFKEFLWDSKRFFKKYLLGCRYDFYEDVVNEIKYKDDGYEDFLNLCKLYYFNEEYDKANIYAQKALERAEKDQKDIPKKDKIDYSIFVYNWLSRISYKTKNHVTAVDFYQKIVDCLIKNPSDLRTEEGIQLKPILHEMVEYLQANRDILNKREQKRIVVPLVLSLIFAIVFEGLQIYSSLGDRENKHTGVLYEKSKYCVLKICTATRLPKENIKDILVEREQNKEKEEQAEYKNNRENIIVALKSSELFKQQHKQKKSNAVIPVRDKHKKTHKPKEQPATYFRDDSK